MGDKLNLFFMGGSMNINWSVVAVVLALGGTALAAPKTFSYGCGTGCGVEARLVGSVEMVADGIKRGAFQQQILTNGRKSGAPNGSMPGHYVSIKGWHLAPAKTSPVARAGNPSTKKTGRRTTPPPLGAWAITTMYYAVGRVSPMIWLVQYAARIISVV